MALPSWFGWWPGTFGRSWLIDGLNLGAPVALLGGLVWLVSGILLIAAGLGFLGVVPLRDAWPTYAVVGGGLGLVAVALYFHPLYLAAVVINLALVTLAWGQLGTTHLAQ
jgi:hypothetical protein